MRLISEETYKNLKNCGYSIRFTLHPISDILEVALGKPGCEMTRHFRIDTFDSVEEAERTIQKAIDMLYVEVFQYEKTVNMAVRTLINGLGSA